MNQIYVYFMPDSYNQTENEYGTVKFTKDTDDISKILKKEIRVFTFPEMKEITSAEVVLS